MEYVVITEHGELVIEVPEDGKTVVIDGQVHQVDMQDIGNRSLFSLLVDNRSYEVLIEEADDGYRVMLAGRLYSVQVRSRDRHSLAKLATPPPLPKGRVEIRAPMPGVVVSVAAQVGQSVSSGQALIILESMKMENEVRAPQDGVVQAVHVRAGEMVNSRQVLVVVE